jgi:protein-tyrosine-phosphatase
MCGRSHAVTSTVVDETDVAALADDDVWPLEDPAQATGTESARLAVFRRVRDEIGERVRAFVAGAPRTR